MEVFHGDFCCLVCRFMEAMYCGERWVGDERLEGRILTLNYLCVQDIDQVKSHL